MTCFIHWTNASIPPRGILNIYRLPTAIWMSNMPPRFRFAKNTFITAYAIMMMQTITMMGLVTASKPEMGFTIRSATVSISSYS